MKIVLKTLYQEFGQKVAKAGFDEKIDYIILETDEYWEIVKSSIKDHMGANLQLKKEDVEDEPLVFSAYATMDRFADVEIRVKGRERHNAPHVPVLYEDYKRIKGI